MVCCFSKCTKLCTFVQLGFGDPILMTESAGAQSNLFLRNPPPPLSIPPPGGGPSLGP